MLTLWTHQLDCQHDMSFCQFVCIVFLCGMWFLWNPSHIPFVIFSSVFSICAFLLIHALCHARTVFTKTFGHWAHPPPSLQIFVLSWLVFAHFTISLYQPFTSSFGRMTTVWTHLLHCQHHMPHFLFTCIVLLCSAQLLKIWHQCHNWDYETLPRSNQPHLSLNI